MAGYIGTKAGSLSTTGADIAGDANIDGDLTVDTSTLHVDSANNRVGVGTDLPSGKVHVYSGASGASPTADLVIEDNLNVQIMLACPSENQGIISFADPASNNAGRIRYVHDDDSMRFDTNQTEVMRISSGNLLVGKTTTASDPDTGIILQADGVFKSTSDGSRAGDFNRGTSDGEIVRFSKDGSTVGSIGINGRLTIDGSSDGTGIYFGGSAWLPRDSGAIVDATVGLGGSTQRFTDLYLSGGVFLGGTGSANKLDDVETGTFTPTLEGTGTAGVRSANSTGYGKYTKVGNLVHFQLYVDANSWTTAPSGHLRIKNLPFSSSSTTGSETTGSVMHNAYNFTYTTLVYFIAGGVNEMRMYSLGDNVGWLQATIGNETMHFYITGTYTTT